MKWMSVLVRRAGLPACAMAGLVGCKTCVSPPSPPPLGVEVDSIMRMQEDNAEASKYVIYMHEFELNDPEDLTGFSGVRLNEYGEDHLRQIAVNLKRGHHYPIVVERSQTSPRPGTQYGYPVHFNDALDARRREVVVASLQALGVAHADQVVVVAPAFAEGLTATESAASYTNSMQGTRGAFGGNGGFFMGGFGGFGGFGFR